MSFYLCKNGEAASIYRRCANDPAAVDPDELFRFNAINVAYYTQCDFAYRHHLRGQFDPDTWERMAYVVTLFASTPGGLEWWEQDKLRFSTQFIEFLEEKTKTFEMPSVLPTVGAGNN